MAETPASDPNHVDAHPTPQRDVELLDYLLIFWRRRVLIAVGTGVSVVAAFVYSTSATPAFEAAATLRANQMQVAGVVTPPIPYTGLQALLNSREMVASAFADAGVTTDLSPAEVAAGRTTLAGISGTNIIRLNVSMDSPAAAAAAANALAERLVALSGDLNSETSMASIGFLDSQLEVAQERVTEAGRKLTEFRRGTPLDLLREQARSLVARIEGLDQRRAQIEGQIAEQRGSNAPNRLSAARQELLDLLLDSQLPAREASFQALVERTAALRTESGEVQSTIAAADAELATAERQLADHPAMLSMTTARNATTPPANGSTPPPGQEVVLNPTYQVLEETVVSKRVELAGLRERQATLARQLAEGEAEVASLDSEIVSKRFRVDQAQREHDLAWEEFQQVHSSSSDGLDEALAVIVHRQDDFVATLLQKQVEISDAELRLRELEGELTISQTLYTSLVVQEEQTRVQLALAVPTLEVLDAAVAPVERTSPNTILNVAAAAIAGLLVFSVLAFLLEYIAAARRKLASA